MTVVNFHLRVWDYPNKQISPCVRTLAVLAILSNLISADMCALSLFKNEGAFFIEIFV